MSISDINTYIALKATLQSQINSDDTVANIQTTLNSIASQKVTILTNLPLSTVLDSLSLATTNDKLNFISTVGFCKLNDTNLYQILTGWFLRIDSQLISETNPTIISDLKIKQNQIKTVVSSVLPTNQINLIKLIIQDL
jgi:hypothetical protein